MQKNFFWENVFVWVTANDTACYAPAIPALVRVPVA